MKTVSTPMKMPEFLVFVRYLASGFFGAEVLRNAIFLGANFASVTPFSPWISGCVTFLGILLCTAYIYSRGGFQVVANMGRSLRFDLLIASLVGVWANELASPWLSKAHGFVERAHPNWAPAIFILLCAVLASPLLQRWIHRSQRTPPQLYFIDDIEVGSKDDDLFACDQQAESFAKTVLSSSGHPGLVFGVDGPWGVGKTSFINLAARHWEEASERVIVCRFEPLRYASEPDLADRLIRDVTATIQRKVFTPELRPAATRYSRLIKGAADVSFFGFKLSLQPSTETVDELLEDIDEVLKRIDCRVIIVVDDLDRLDPKTVNNVLFATRRTFKLSQATYILCYDTEVLAGGHEESSRAREFLEKFVTVKLSLFVDSSRIQEFLTRDWQRAENHMGSIPSDTMVKLGAVLNELAQVLSGDQAAEYMPLVGDLRKVKRFVNAVLLMQLEKTDLGRTDFNKRDLINLILLHLYYPGLFRRIYAEETEGRCGTFSVSREVGEGREFVNSPSFLRLMSEQQQEPARLLLAQLFDATTLELRDLSDVDEAVLASRACFNQGRFRNLEAYLKLIVRFATPEPRETFVLYQSAVVAVKSGTPISSVLTSDDFELEDGEYAHDQFWRLLVNQSYDLTQAVAEDAVNTLIDYLPRYSTIAFGDRGLRQRSIYSLLRLLDSAGWGRTPDRPRANDPDNILEIAWRIFGEQSYVGRGLVQRLADDQRGVLGWYDLMLFRLQCSIDRQGQLHNLHSALILHHDRSAPTSGAVSNLALMGMRGLSQAVFALFKTTFVDPANNFFSAVNATPDVAFLGVHRSHGAGEPIEDPDLVRQVAVTRSSLKSFVIYQLSNSNPPAGSGVGCGYYSESGFSDSGGIARLMNEYVFDVCFNPDVDPDNIYHFLDHCLSHLSNSFFTLRSDEEYVPTRTDLPGGLDPQDMGSYWRRHGGFIRRQTQQGENRHVVTVNYTASYQGDLSRVFAVLDELALEAVDETGQDVPAAT